MDKDRQIRFLYPPLIFLGSIAFGIWLDHSDVIRNLIEKFLKGDNNTKLTVALLGAGSIVLVTGFLLGTITVLILRVLFPNNRFSYEFKLAEKSYDKIGKLILKSKDDKIKKEDRMYAGVVFDHSYISENIHLWIVRRWNAFFIASSSIVGLILSLLVGHLLGVAFTCGWVLTVIGSIILFTIQGWSSWIETMRMIVFMTRVKKNDRIKNTEEEGNEPDQPASNSE